MKRFALLLFTVSSLIACNNRIDESKLIGEWVVEEFNANTPELSPMLIEATRAEVISTVYTLNSDGKILQMSSFNPEGIEGVWVLNPANNLLEITYEEDEEFMETFAIESIDMKRMIWNQDLEDLGSLTYVLARKE